MDDLHNEMQIAKRNLATARAVLNFWDSSFWRLVYRWVLKHKFPPATVHFRYEMLAQRKIDRIARLLRAENTASTY